MDQLASEGAPYEQLITFVKDRAGHDFRYAINSELLQSTIGWYPKVHLGEALCDLIQLKMVYYAE